MGLGSRRASMSVFGAIAAVLAALLCGPAAVAMAGPVAEPRVFSNEAPRLELSADGVSFVREYPGALFSERSAIPAASEVDHFWVKNSSGGPAVLSLAITDLARTAPEIRSALSLHLESDAQDFGVVQLDELGECAALPTVQTMENGEAVRITVTLDMAELSGRAGQNAAIGFNVRTILTEQAAGTGEAVDCTVAGPSVPVVTQPSVPGPMLGFLAATGSPARYVLLAVLAALAGWGIVAWRARAAELRGARRGDGQT